MAGTCGQGVNGAGGGKGMLAGGGAIIGGWCAWAAKVGATGQAGCGGLGMTGICCGQGVNGAGGGNAMLAGGGAIMGRGAWGPMEGAGTQFAA